jgi:hypothetical protein
MQEKFICSYNLICKRLYAVEQHLPTYAAREAFKINFNTVANRYDEVKNVNLKLECDVVYIKLANRFLWCR